jgi:hypothetical protein
MRIMEREDYVVVINDDVCGKWGADDCDLLEDAIPALA